MIIEVPEAEPVVGTYRLRLDHQAALGVPAHITVLFPFVPALALDHRLRAELAELSGQVPAFDFVLDRTGWFGEHVLWLGPADPGPFRELTARLHAAHPDYPPFGGQFDEVVPHLTVGHQMPVSELHRAERAIRARLPVRGRAERLSLMVCGRSGRWEVADSFALG